MVQKGDPSEIGKCPRFDRALAYPSGTAWWIKTKGGDWCEYSEGRPQNYWANVRRPDADRALTFWNGRALLGYTMPFVISHRSFRNGPCSDNKAVDFFNKALPKFEGMTVCSVGHSSTHRVKYLLEEDRSGYVPVITFEPIEKTSGTSMLYLFGGPYVDLFGTSHHAGILGKLLADSRLTVIVPFYIGIPKVRVARSENLPLATAQIRGLSQTHSRSSRRTCAVGASLGGYVLAGVDLPGVDRLLVSPRFDSAARHIKRNQLGNATDGSMTLLEMTASDWAQHRWNTARALHTTAREAYAYYFGPEVDLDLAGRMRSAHSSVTILYGSKDQVIGVDWLSYIQQSIDPTRVKDVGPVGHNADDATALWAFEPYIDRFVNGCVGPAGKAEATRPNGEISAKNAVTTERPANSPRRSTRNPLQ